MLREDQIKVSVVIPAYNAEPYIRTALNSVLSGQDLGLEVIVVDDCSSDGTGDVVDEAAAMDDRLRLIRHDANRGESHARNTGNQAARGEWIAILDADDWYAPDRLATLIQLAEANGTDIVADNQYWTMERADRPWRSLFPKTDRSSRILNLEEFWKLDVVGSPVNPGYLKPIIRRSFLKNSGITYDPSYRVGEDFHFLSRCLLHADELVLCNTPYYHYLNRPESVSNTTSVADLKSMRAANDDLMGQLTARHGDNVTALLKRRDKFLDLAIRHREIRNELARGRIIRAARGLLRDPTITPFTAMSLMRGARSRLQRRLSRIPRAAL